MSFGFLNQLVALRAGGVVDTLVHSDRLTEEVVDAIHVQDVAKLARAYFRTADVCDEELRVARLHFNLRLYHLLSVQVVAVVLLETLRVALDVAGLLL